MIARVPTDSKSDPTAYGYPVYQGFLVMGYDPDKGLYVRGIVTHADKAIDYTQNFTSYDDILSMIDQESLYGSRAVTRGLYVGDTLFTVSAGLVKATSLTDFSTLGSVVLPGATDSYPGGVMPMK